MKPLRLVKLFRLLKVSTVYRFLNEYDIMLFRKSLAELALHTLCKIMICNCETNKE